MSLRLEILPDGFALWLGGTEVLRHDAASPLLHVGRGEGRMDMYRGNFDIEDYLVERVKLTGCRVRAEAGGWVAAFEGGGRAMRVRIDGDAATLSFETDDPGINRVWLRLPALADEPVWGCGEQMSYLDLRGRRFPIWTREPGVGRDKSTWITWRADVEGRAGGDYHTTNYPQPTFISSRGYACHVETGAYSVFDFRHDGFHEVEVWAVPERVELFAAPGLAALVQRLSDRFGRAPPPPDWALEGAIIGLKDGAAGLDRLQAFRDAGAVVSAVWCEDWCGVRQTSFGKRLFWDWRWDAKRYPALMERVQALGTRLLGYVNPYLCNDGGLFAVAEAAGYLARNAAGGTYLVDFGEFDAGVVDFTNPAASDWFAREVIGANMIGFGLSGWMADFGEYLPIDVKLASGVDATLMHNPWPVLWAEVNARAVAASGRGDLLFFMRAGYTGVQRHCPLLWAGDQSVDFSRHDGLQTVIVAALSSGLLGNAFHHSDIGGYTSLFGNVRTAELIQRWAEMAAFTPVMRSHEGNRPAENLQIDGDAAVLAHFARMTRLHAHLLPYLRHLVAEAATGLPLQRPLFLHFPDDRDCRAVQDQYLLGADLLVAPVHAAGAVEWPVRLPAGTEWVHVWTGAAHDGGRLVRIPAPLGAIPVFYRRDSAFAGLFAGLAAI